MIKVDKEIIYVCVCVCVCVYLPKHEIKMRRKMKIIKKKIYMINT